MYKSINNCFTLVQGMAYLHASSVHYHGNLTSSNILIDNRWTCKLSDFGLKEFRAGESGPIKGEPAYYYGNCLIQVLIFYIQYIVFEYGLHSKHVHVFRILYEKLGVYMRI